MLKEHQICMSNLLGGRNRLELGVFDPDTRDDRLGTIMLIRHLASSSFIPIIAAGGIVDGAGLAASMVLGATARRSTRHGFKMEMSKPPLMIGLVAFFGSYCPRSGTRL